MKLPKIDYPILNIEVPSLKKKYRFRPFLVKEEKLLLMAKESQEDSEIFSTIKQIVVNCSLDDKLDIDKLAIFDLEYLFLQLRASSVDNKIEVGYRDFDDDKIYNFEVDLNEIKVIFPEKTDNVIKITENAGLIMRYPSASLYSDKEFLSAEEDHLFKLICKCIDQIYDGEEVFQVSDFSSKDIENFLETLSVKVFEQVHKFLLSTPKIEYVLKYENSLGDNKEIKLNSLNDFFIWR